MDLKPHEERVIQERNELQEKADKLSKFFETSTYIGLGDRDKDLLISQINAMNNYLSILNERIGRFVSI